MLLRPARLRPLRPVALCAALLCGLAACGGGTKTPGGITDAGAEQVSDSVPEWFPTNVPGPPGGVIVDVISKPSTDNEAIQYGRSVTWRVDRSYQTVLTDVDALLASLGWQPTDRLATTGDQDSKRTSIYIENGTVEVIRVYEDANLKGVRVTIELPR